MAFWILITGLLALTALQFWLFAPLYGLAAVFATPLLLTTVFQRPDNGRRQVLAAVILLPYFVIGATEWIVSADIAAGVEVALCVIVQLVVVTAAARRRKRAASDTAIR